MSRLGERLQLVWRAWRYRMRLDRAEIRYILDHVTSGQCAVDVGAHKGAYTYWLQNAVGRQGRVFVFEPQPLLAARLRGLLASATNVIFEEAAVSDRSGEATLVLPPGSSTCGATLEERENARNSQSVRTIALDDYLRAWPSLRVSFIKCDVEGHELKVFQGAENVLRTHRPSLLFECEKRHHRNDTMGDVFSYLESLAYDGWFFLRGEQTPLSRFDPGMQAAPDREPYVNNFLFTPRA